MEISSVDNYSNVVQSTSNGQSLGKNEFFQILSAQLQFQDPLEGGDNSEYVAQLAQFSSLEQMENLNMAIADLKSNQNLLFGSNLIGKTVIVAGESGVASGEVQSVRVRGSELYVVVDEREYLSSDIIDMAGTEDEKANRIIEEMEHVSEVLDSVFAPETQETAETL